MWAEARSSAEAEAEPRALTADAAALEVATACSSAALSSVAEPHASHVVVVILLMRVHTAQTQVVGAEAVRVGARTSGSPSNIGVAEALTLSSVEYAGENSGTAADEEGYEEEEEVRATAGAPGGD